MKNDSGLYVGRGLYDIEPDGNRHFRWASEVYDLYLDNTIESVTLEIFSNFKSQCSYHKNGHNTTLLYNQGFNKITLLNNRNSKSNFKRFTYKDKAFSYYIYNEIISIYENKQLK